MGFILLPWIDFFLSDSRTDWGLLSSLNLSSYHQLPLGAETAQGTQRLRMNLIEKGVKIHT